MFYLERHKIFDRPNERSSHIRPTLRGGGLGLVPVILMAWLIVAWLMQTSAPSSQLQYLGWVIFGAVILAVVSWRDDIISQPPLARLFIQISITGLIVWSALPSEPVFQGLLPRWLDQLLSLLIWVWFINLFNFMDGIDGLAGLETICIGLGIAILGMANHVGAINGLYGLTIAAAAIGFLRWNWHPAKIFLGDVGSIPLGFLLGWLLLRLASEGAWAAALILPLYYFVDTTLTLVRRIIRKQKVWEPHRSHFYQQAVNDGLSHGSVTLIIGGFNIILMALALYSIFSPFVALGIAIASTTVLLIWFQRRSRK